MGADIKFFQYSRPEWESGDYKLEIEQFTNIPKNPGSGDSVTYSGDIGFTMTKKRFSLEAEDIYSVYPPAGSTGLFGTCLPHVVLKRSTVPWEYRLSAVGSEKEPAAGIALLVFSEDEGIKPFAVKIGEIGADLPEGGYVSPDMKQNSQDADHADDECQIVDIPGKLFAEICPTRRELSLLSHVRKVKLDDKVTDPQIEQGMFACVTANRYPKEPQEGEKPVEHMACLVSLKEYEAFLDKRQEAERYSAIRLLCLHKFSFFTGRESYDFTALMKHLDPNVLAAEVPSQIVDERLRDILLRGYYPMDHDLRDGSKTVSWYRGPFLPYEETPVAPHYQVYSDSHYKMDPETGMLDVSYACAWELGRMFAMENLSTCRELMEWRYQNYKKAAKEEQKQQIMKQLAKGQTGELNTELAAVCANMLQNLSVYQEDVDEGSVDITE